MKDWENSRDKAFSEGCDARIRGLQVTANPYPKSGDTQLYRAWRLGWYDVHHFWGALARWPHQALPVVTAPLAHIWELQL